MAGPAPSGYESARPLSWPMGDEICLANNRLWCEVLEDANPAYYDEAVAARLFGGIIAPPTMVMAWCVQPEWKPTGQAWTLSGSLKNEYPDFPHVVGLKSTQQHSCPLRMGERLTVDQFTNPAQAPATSHRGPGRQVNIYHSLRNDSGQEVVNWINQTLRFAAPLAAVDPDANLPALSAELLAGADANPRAKAGTIVDIGDVQEGEMLPPLALPLTVKRFIKWVAATRDYFDAHHNRDYARGMGARDMYIGVHFFHGLVGRLITDWGGPGAFLRSMEVLSWGRAFPGETARAAGRVVKVDRERSLAQLVIECGCERGKLYDVSATVQLVQPGQAL